MFKCSGCGLCCQHVNKAVEALKDIELMEFPYKWDEGGRCEMLTEDNGCSVYENRPLMCNVDKVAEIFELEKEPFYRLNAKVCNSMMDEENLPLSFRI